MQTFINKVAVITGAASGIGRAIAEKCVQEKIKVVLADVDKNNLLKTEHALKEKGAEIITIVTDVSKKEDIKILADVTLNNFGEVHLLFNNAGIIGPIRPIWEASATEIERVIQIDLMGVIYGLQAFLPIMLAQQHQCHIINTASGAGLHTSPYTSGYAAAKHAIVALSEVLYYDLQQCNADIHVSVLCPGSVKTAIVEQVNTKTGNTELDKIASFFKQRLEDGIEPAGVAEQVFAAIRANQFYILTHPEHKPIIESRMRDIIDQRNPSRDFSF